MDRTEMLRIAAAAQCDPRTVKAFVEGAEVRPLLRERIEAAMKRLKVGTKR